MNRKSSWSGAVLVTFLLAGCVSGPSEQREVRATPATFPTLGLESVMGSNARALTTQFGTPDLDVREGTARKLQFVSPICVLDAYLYPPSSGAEPVVTYLDARLPDGRDMDRASCVAAISRRGQAR